MIPQEISALLRTTFGDTILEEKLDGVFDPWFKVAPEKIADVAQFLRDHEQAAFDALMCLSGVDYTGGKLGVVYHLHSTAWNHKCTLKVDVPADNPHCGSLAQVWRTADWHEREAYDLFGIIFDGHPDLRRILLPYDWEGFPLRKDYEVPEYYQGMKVPY